MKNVVLLLLFLGVSIGACKEEVDRPNASESMAPNMPEPTKEIALNMGISSNDLPERYLYVTARSGLSLRAYNNLQSERLAKMPYGSRVKVLEAEGRPTMTVGGISGGMDKIAYNHKTGFAFNGYLSRYFPPEQNISPQGYADELKLHFPEVSFIKTTGGSVSNPETVETLKLPGGSWHEAFFVAQQLFDFPKQFDFPSDQGPVSQVVVDHKPGKSDWTSQLEITRADDGLDLIRYHYEAKQFKSIVDIRKEQGNMVLQRTETIK